MMARQAMQPWLPLELPISDPASAQHNPLMIFGQPCQDQCIEPQSCQPPLSHALILISSHDRFLFDPLLQC